MGFVPDAANPLAMGGVSRDGVATNGRIMGNPSGGVRFQDECPDGEVIVGVAGFLRAGATCLGQLQALCGRVLFDADVARTENGAVGPLRGQGGDGLDVSSICPNGQAVVGHSGRSGNLMDQLVLHCAPLAVRADNIVIGAALPSLPIGGEGGGAYNLIPCSDDQVAIGVIIRAGADVDGFGLRCSGLNTQP